MRKFPRLNDHKQPNIRMIVQARGFGTAKIPILEVEWVYSQATTKCERLQNCHIGTDYA